MRNTEDKESRDPKKKGNAEFYAGQCHIDKFNEQAAKLLMEDPNIFAYDEIYDDMKKDKEKANPVKSQLLAAQQPKPTSKYIKSIISTVGRRERQHEIVHEKMVSKKVKRDNEDGPQEIFVTSSYLKQKEAEKAYELQQKKAEEYNNKHSVNNKETNQYEFTARLFRNEFGDAPNPVKPKEQTAPLKQVTPKPKFYSEKAHKEKVTKGRAEPNSQQPQPKIPSSDPTPKDH